MSPDRSLTLRRAGAPALAYRSVPGRAPGVVFLPGYRSDMTGAKALALDAWCRRGGRAFLRFDYSGHGESGGAFESLVLSDWIADAAAMLHAAGPGPQVLVGSSMGAWIMLRVAELHPQRVAGLVGLASAPDFTEDRVFARLPAEEQANVMAGKTCRLPSANGQYETVVTRALIEDGRRHLVLRSEVIAVDAPVRLLHGDADDTVPWQASAEVLRRIRSTDATLTVIKGTGHRLSEPAELELVVRTVDALCAEIEAR